MSIQDYHKAVDLIEENQELGDFVGKCSEELVKKTEAALNLVFPETYRSFLLNYGSGNFGSEEIYGIVKEDFNNSGIPDAIWFTLKQRLETRLPPHLVIIYHTGGEEIFCLDFSKTGDLKEPAVVSYIIGVDTEKQPYEVVANDFGEFLLQRVQLELGIQ